MPGLHALTDFDFKNPDYVAVFQARLKRLAFLRGSGVDSADPLEIAAVAAQRLAFVKGWYRDHPADFINDWGTTFDPRNVDRGLPANVPFILFPRQREWVEFVFRKWRERKSGLSPKTRDAGVSWLAVGTADTLCMFYEGMVIGFGSRKEEYVDKSDTPKSLFYKARKFMDGLPVDFKGNWSSKRNAPHMRLNFPDTGSYITGEAGDGIGRGDRAGIYFTDEEAFLERPLLVENSLSQTTNCRISISSANGMTNPFYTKIAAGKIETFWFRWTDDPRKDQAWYDEQVENLDPVTVAQEIDINFSASVEGVLIPSTWVQAAIDAHERLGVTPTGARRGAFDVADEGKDKCAFLSCHGILVDFAKQWSGKGDDIFGSVQTAFDCADDNGLERFTYDADGLGAGVRGDARVINAQRLITRQKRIDVGGFRGSGPVFLPQSEDVKGRKNEDFFMNAKAQAWWRLRMRFQKTYRAVSQGVDFKPEEIISLSKSMPNLNELVAELSQPTYIKNTIGKILVDKMPDGAKSPNLADGLMMLYSPTQRSPMRISAEAVAATQ